MKFWIPWSIAVAVALVFVCFFLIGLGDGTVSSFPASSSDCSFSL